VRSLAVLRTLARQERRDLLTVALSLMFAPLFVVLYAALYGAGTTYQVAVVDADRPVSASGGGGSVAAGHDLVEALRQGDRGGGQGAASAGSASGSGSAAGSAGMPAVRLDVRTVSDRDAGLTLLRHKDADVLVEIPADLSARVARRDPAALTLDGNPTDQKYLVTAVLVGQVAQAYVSAETGRAAPVTLTEHALRGTDALSDFDLSVAGLLIFSVVILVFLASMTVARDVESGVMRRLRLTGMRPTDYLAGTSGMLTVVALAGVLFTFATALACGFRSNGPVWAAALVTALTALSVIGVGLVVGALSRTVARAFVIANFPLGLMMFTSGSVFPFPQPTLVTLAGHGLGPFDLIPATAAVSALNKILTLGQGITQVSFELVQLVVLSLLYFALGAVVLHRRHLRVGAA
jgi:ABC-2 type transport system permease protein